ncbi:MAG: response regulator transcription factor [Burkholderiales bacterium]|nr:response regulator transcription factor [Burkholderiales bacterium]
MRQRLGPSCRVLVVEDDRTIAGNLVEYIEANGPSVDIAYDGPAAIARLTSESFDVIVLDLGLPRLDGLSVLNHVRRSLGIATPVLILTARDQIASKQEGFNAGADDYLTKPFALAEVMMRITALHRRAGGGVVEDTVSAGELRFDRRTRQVYVHGLPVRLMPRSLQLLDRLLRDPGRVVTRSELEAALWPSDVPESDALRSQVHILRRALVQARFHGLETIPKVGYRLRCDSSTGA